MPLSDSLRRYFDITRRPAAAASLGEQKKYAVPQYLTVVAGIVAQPFLDYYLAHSTWNVSGTAILGRLIFGLIAGIVVFPAIYRNSIDNSSPLFVQLCTVFTAGLGWQTLFSSAFKAGAQLVH